ncbi:MAG TPA: hypothetical protein VFG43_12605 [Geminicoccaceae bacterium]|nr:hypothetical protein [Geminicoccaceae bacterium]
MGTGGSLDYERALSDPHGVFGEPAKVLAHPGLDAAQKRAVLENWWQDAMRLSESESEAMGGGEEAMLQRVNEALLELERQTGLGSAHKRTIT